VFIHLIVIKHLLTYWDSLGQRLGHEGTAFLCLGQRLGHEGTAVASLGHEGHCSPLSSLTGPPCCDAAITCVYFDYKRHLKLTCVLNLLTDYPRIRL